MTSRAVLRSAGLSLVSAGSDSAYASPRPSAAEFGRSGSHAMPINVYAEAEQKLGSSSSRLRAATDCTMPINIVAEIPKQTLSPKAALRPCQSEPRLRPSSARLQVEQPTVMRHNRKMKRTATLDNKVRRLLEDDELELCKEAPHPAAREADLTVASLCGRVSEKDRYQPYFSGKRMDFSQLGQFEALPHKLGVHCQRGQKPDSPNQDDFFVLQTNTWLFCGVADGHGENGHKVSHFVQEQLPQAVLQRLKTENFTNWRTSVVGAVDEVQSKLKLQIPDEATDSGSTASMVFLSKDPEGKWKLQSTFIGDSMIVYARRPKESLEFEVELVTSTHRPDRQDEFQRISLSNGQVILGDDPSAPSRLRVPAGDMAMSRALGDLDAHQYGMSSEPEFPGEYCLQDEDEHLIILCSDGVWDMIKPREAVNIAAKFEAQRAAERLAAKAQSRWQEEGGPHVDDITVIVVRTGGESKQHEAHADAFGSRGSRPNSFR